MNESELWTVYHEPAPKIQVLADAREYGIHLQAAQRVLDKDYYGEVNSMRRRIAKDIKVAKCGVIIRHPVELMLSAINRKGVHQQWIDELGESLVLIDELVRKGWPIIWFDWLTTDPEYTQQVIREFGIYDVEVTEEKVFTKVNETTHQKYKNLSALTPEMLQDYNQKTSWFIKKYIKGRKLLEDKQLGPYKKIGGQRGGRRART